MGRQGLRKHPCYTGYRAAQARCRNPNDISYKYYGGRGIKLLMTPTDFKLMWDRDKAHLLERPSVDRIDPDKDYTLANCRYVEQSFNIARSNTDKPRTTGKHWKWSRNQ